MQDVLHTVYFYAVPVFICQAGYASIGTQKSTKANVPVHGLGTANIANNAIALYFYGVTSPSQQAELAKCDTAMQCCYCGHSS